MTAADVTDILRKHRELEGLISARNWWLGLFTAIVALGILAETLVEFWYSKDKPRREVILTVICSLIVLGGVIGEYMESGRIAESADQLQGLADRDVADLYRQSADANERAAKAAKSTEDERSARLKFEKLYGPRRLTRAQREGLIKAFHKYAGRTVTIRGLWDSETDAFSFDLEDILRTAGLKVKRDPTTPTISASGVIVEGSWADFTVLRDFVHSLNCAGVWANDWESCTGGLPPCSGVLKQIEPKTCDFVFDILPRLVGHRGEELDAFAARLCKMPLVTQNPTCAP